MQSLPETIILKASFNEDIRRVKLSSFDFITLQNQISQLFSLGDLNSFVLKYRDDEGDMISIFTNEELQEAISFDQKILRIYVSLKDQPKKRIHKKRVKKNDKKAENIPNNTNNTPGFRDILNDPNVDPFAFIQPLYQNLFQEGKINDIIQNVITNDYSETINEFLPFFSTQNNNNNSQPEKVLHNAFCDRCDKRIEGLRWKCFDCSDFDYCNECYIVAHGNEDKKTHLKTHVFGMMENPCSTSNYQQEKEKHLEKLRIEKEKQEKERLEKEKLENERKEKEEKEKQEKERLEKERQNKEEEEKNKIDQEKIVYPFEQKLQDLQNMGFVDRKRNIQILIKHKGSISHAIQELLDSN